jgi:bifunctional non-homologous end joining protein LigD
MDGPVAPKGRPGAAGKPSRATPRASRATLNRKPFITTIDDEAQHVYRCDACGQDVDRRRLGDVLHHEEPDHQPIPNALRDTAGLRFIEPMLPALVDEPPDGDEWLHEIKYDGYRTQVIITQGEARAFTRRGYDWTAKYAPIVACARTLPCQSSIIEGELIMQDKKGRSDFHALRAGIEREPQRLILMAFDLLHLDGEDLLSRPVEQRRELLRRLLGPNEPHRPIHFSEHVVGNGRQFFAAVEGMQLEGIVSKKLGSRYRSGETRSWLKTKSFGEEDLVLIGTSKGDRAPVALLAREDASGLTYVGGAMVTLAQPERDQFWEAAETIRTPAPAIPMEPRKETGWVRPEMRVKVRTLRGEEMLRHATVVAITQLPQRRSPVKPKRGSAEPHFPKPLLDREAIRAYYREMAPLLLPWIAQRPLNLVRCGEHSCWYQRNVSHPKTEPGTFSPAIGRVPVAQKNGKTEDYLFVEDEAAIEACLDAGVIEFHGWGSRVADIEKPDRLVIDLDPDEAIGFEAVKDAALTVRDALARVKLKSFALLSGGKGIHVVVPLLPRAEWADVRAFAFNFCRALAEAEPGRFTVALPKKERRGRIFLDYLRNQRTATAVLPYSLRARSALPIAAPIAWTEITGLTSPRAFTAGDAKSLKRRARGKALKEWGVAAQFLPGSSKLPALDPERTDGEGQPHGAK